MTDNQALPRYARMRQPKRKVEDQQRIDAILDKGLVAHVAFIHEQRPMVIPMAYAYRADAKRLYLHGASKTRIIKLFQDGDPMCLSVTMMDGIVMARSGMNMSANYRSVVVHGHTRLVTDSQEHHDALFAITQHIAPGHWDSVRPMSDSDIKATGVLALEIEHMSCKIRSGGPVDEPEDLAQPSWGGHIPIETRLLPPVADAHTPPGYPEPTSVAATHRKFDRA